MSNDAAAHSPPWKAAHEAACAAGAHSYIDPRTGYQVFTGLGLRARGECCGAGCRHCPFGHEMVNARNLAARIQQPALLNGQVPQGEVDVVFWSGGKDSLLALRAWLRSAPQRNLSVQQARARLMLLTSFDARSRTVAHQEVAIADVQRQAQALALPLLGVPLHAGGDFLERITAAIEELRRAGASPAHLVFGDLHLEHIRAWRDESLSGFGARLVYPLWGIDTQTLLADLLASGVPCVVSACPGPPASPKLGNEREHDAPAPVHPFAVGARYDARLAGRASAAGWDPFGEHGEFHTLAHVWAQGATPLGKLSSAGERTPLSS